MAEFDIEKLSKNCYIIIKKNFWGVHQSHRKYALHSVISYWGLYDNSIESTHQDVLQDKEVGRYPDKRPLHQRTQRYP